MSAKSQVERNEMDRMEEITDELIGILREGGAYVPQAQRLLGCLGEYLVLRELKKRGIGAKLLGGNRKSTDIVTESNHRIQVKTSRMSTVVTRIAQKDFTKGAPDIWVLISMKGGLEFFVLTHAEIVPLQEAINEAWRKRHRERTGEEFDPRKGVDKLPFSAVARFKDEWDKIIPPGKG